MYLRNAQRTRVSISSGARGVRRCRRRRRRGRDSSGARIRSNRKFHPLPGWQRATLRTRLAVEQVDSPSRTKRRTSASKRERDRQCPSLPLAGEEIRAAGMSEVRRYRRRRGWWRHNHLGLVRWGRQRLPPSPLPPPPPVPRAPHPATVRTGVGRANPTRHPGIRTGTTHKVHRAGPATPARGAALFSLLRRLVTSGNPPPLFWPRRHRSPTGGIGASHRVALPNPLRKLGCMRECTLQP